jgi:hypothetical protein
LRVVALPSQQTRRNTPHTSCTNSTPQKHKTTTKSNNKPNQNKTDVHNRIEETSATSASCVAPANLTGTCLGGWARISTIVNEARKNATDAGAGFMFLVRGCGALLRGQSCLFRREGGLWVAQPPEKQPPHATPRPPTRPTSPPHKSGAKKQDAGDQFDGSLWDVVYRGAATAVIQNLQPPDAMQVRVGGCAGAVVVLLLCCRVLLCAAVVVLLCAVVLARGGGASLLASSRNNRQPSHLSHTHHLLPPSPPHHSQLGNHEFSFPAERLASYIRNVSFPILGAWCAARRRRGGELLFSFVLGACWCFF